MVGQVNLLEEIQRHATLRAISIRYLVRQQLLPQHAMQRLPRPPTLLYANRPMRRTHRPLSPPPCTGENVSEQARSVNGVVDTRSGGDDAGDCIEGHPLVRGNRRRQLHKITAQSALTSKTSGRHAVKYTSCNYAPPAHGGCPDASRSKIYHSFAGAWTHRHVRLVTCLRCGPQIQYVLRTRIFQGQQTGSPVRHTVLLVGCQISWVYLEGWG